MEISARYRARCGGTSACRSTRSVGPTSFGVQRASPSDFSSSRAQSALALSEDIEILPQLQPGIESRGIAAFEIPRDAATGEVTLEFTERGFLGSSIERIVVTLPAAPAAAPAPAEATMQ